MTDRSSTTWEIQDANTTDWREDVRVPADPLPADPTSATDWGQDIRLPGGSGGISQSFVESVFGRGGHVVAEFGDYESALVSIAPEISVARPWGDVRLYLTNLSTQVDTAQSTADNAVSIANGAPSKAYVDAADALLLPKSGGTMTGFIVLHANASAAMNPVTKQQLDALSSTIGNYLPLTGGTLSGNLTIDRAVAGSSTISLQNTGAVTGLTQLYRSATGSGFFDIWNQAPSSQPAIISLSPSPSSAAQDTLVQLFRATTAAGKRALQWIKGDGSTTVVAEGILNSAFDGLDWTGRHSFTGTTALKVPAGTQAQRPTGVAGQIRYNSDTVGFEGFTTSWGALGGGAFYVAPTPPSAPAQGSPWWNSEDGTLYTYYDDGNSQAWVPATPMPAGSTAQTSDLLSAEDNLLINGGMDVWQRASTFASFSGTTAVKTADRWVVIPDTGATVDVMQSTAADTEGVRYTLRLNRTVAGSGSTLLYQSIENVRTAGGQTVTVSFSVRSQFATTGMYVYFAQIFGTGGSPSTTVASAIAPFSTGVNTVERKTMSIAIPSVLGKTVGTNGDDSFRFLIVIPSSIGAAIFHFTDIDVHIGSLAPTKFLRRPIQQEVALCQRYCQRFSGLVIDTYGAAGAAVDCCSVSFMTVMRAQPTSSYAVGPTYTNASNLVVASATGSAMRFKLTPTATGTATAFADVLLDAEL